VTSQRITFRVDSGSTYRVTVADAHAGNVSSTEEAAQVAYLIDWQTGDPRKGGKPRQYITGVPTNQLADPANVSSGTISTVNTALTTWLGGLAARSHGTASGLELVEMSFRDGKAWRAEGHPFTVISGFLNPVLATQRRRVDRLRA
jgi:hypothetical protein